MALETTDDDEMFRTVTDSLQLGGSPAVIVSSHAGAIEAYYYPQGLSAPDSCRAIQLHTSDIDMARLTAIVERVYEELLKTPGAPPPANRVWENASRHRPRPDAEHRIQALLRPAFVGAWPTCRVRAEVPGVMGRADIEIVEHDVLDQSRVTHLAVLELKVLRSFSEGGEPYSEAESQRAVEEGIEQAGAYRNERHHRIAALYCFDMRATDTGEECFELWRTLADEMSVQLHRWYLYASARLARKAARRTGR